MSEYLLTHLYVLRYFLTILYFSENSCFQLKRINSSLCFDAYKLEFDLKLNILYYSLTRHVALKKLDKKTEFGK